MAPKKAVSISKAPPNLKAKLAEVASGSSHGKKGPGNELDQLMNMSYVEIYPYACFMVLVIIAILYNFIPSILGPIVEFQYPVDDEFEEKSSVPRYGANSGNKMKFFGTGYMDAFQMPFIYLGIVSFNVLVTEIAQLAAKYVLKAPKKIQEVATIKGTSLVFHLVMLSSGVGLIPEDIFGNLSSLWIGNSLPISRSLKFYLLVQISFQIATLVSYLLNVPTKSMKSTTILGHACAIVLGFYGYFSGFYVGSLVIFMLFDLTSAFLEILILLDCVNFQKPQLSPSRQLRGSMHASWIVLRVFLPFALLGHYCYYRINKVSGAQSPSDIFNTSDYVLFGGVLSLITMQFVWFLDVQQATSSNPKAD